MYIYICIYTYGESYVELCTYIYIYRERYVYIYIYINESVCTHIYIYIYIYAHNMIYIYGETGKGGSGEKHMFNYPKSNSNMILTYLKLV